MTYLTPEQAIARVARSEELARRRGATPQQLQRARRAFAEARRRGYDLGACVECHRAGLGESAAGRGALAIGAWGLVLGPVAGAAAGAVAAGSGKRGRGALMGAGVGLLAGVVTGAIGGAVAGAAIS